MFLVVRICMCNYTKVFVRHPSSVHGKPWWCTNALGSGIYQELSDSQCGVDVCEFMNLHDMQVLGILVYTCI